VSNNVINAFGRPVFISEPTIAEQIDVLKHLLDRAKELARQTRSWYPAHQEYTNQIICLNATITELQVKLLNEYQQKISPPG
jgi:hypothetical protein